MRGQRRNIKEKFHEHAPPPLCMFCSLLVTVFRAGVSRVPYVWHRQRHHDGAFLGQRGRRVGQRQEIRRGE